MKAAPRPDWSKIQVFHATHKAQIEAGRAVMLKELAAAELNATPEDLAALREYRKQIQES